MSMITFFEANQVRLILKMQLSNYSWYNNCQVLTSEDNSGYLILLGLTKTNNTIQNIINVSASIANKKANVKNVLVKVKVE
jgi:hypothetical protein